MTSGKVKNIIYDRMIIIEYKDIEISYRDLDIDNIKVGDTIKKGQLLGKRKGLDSRHNYFNGIMIRVKYKGAFFDIGYIFNIIFNINNEKKTINIENPTNIYLTRNVYNIIVIAGIIVIIIAIISLIRIRKNKHNICPFLYFLLRQIRLIPGSFGANAC
jgi:ribosomal protein L19